MKIRQSGLEKKKSGLEKDHLTIPAAHTILTSIFYGDEGKQ